MKKIKVLICVILCCAITISAGFDNTYAYDDSLPVFSLNNKDVFYYLRTAVPQKTINSNYSYNNVYSRIPAYVYDQDTVNLKVGTSKFKDVGCEIAACYNATALLVDADSQRNKRYLYYLPKYIKIAEENKFTMSLSSKDIRTVIKKILLSYCDSKAEKFAFSYLISLFPKGYVRLAARLADEDLSKLAGFGTDPFTIPKILEKGGLCKVSGTFTSYNTLQRSVGAALKGSSTTIYIISYWNRDTLPECLEDKTGFHTICFYVLGGKIYTYNNNPGVTNRAVKEDNLQEIMGGTNRFIVGYTIVHQ